MTILITLTTIGIDAGPFDVYTSPDGIIYTIFATNIPASTLSSGYIASPIPDDTICIKVQSVGICLNYIILNVVTTTTTTTTTTTLFVPSDVIFNIAPPIDAGPGSNPRTEYWSSQIIGPDEQFTVEITGTEIAHTGGNGQLYVSVDPDPDFSLKVWDAIIGPGGFNPYSLTFIGGTYIYFMVIAGSTPGDSTTMQVQITSTSVGVIGSPDTITMTSTT
jgi:hypothetical protein